MTAAGVVSLDEHRHLRAEEARHDAEALDRAYALEQARTILARLGGHDTLAQLEPVAAGDCADCQQHAEHRWRHAQLELCRRCALARLRVGRLLAQPEPAATAAAAGTIYGWPSWFDCLVHWVKTCHLELDEHQLRGRLNSYKLAPDRYLLSNDQKRTLIRLHRHLRDQHERGVPQRPTDLETWVRAHADRLTLTELERQLDQWHVVKQDRYPLADLLADRRRQLGIHEAA